MLAVRLCRVACPGSWSPWRLAVGWQHAVQNHTAVVRERAMTQIFLLRMNIFNFVLLPFICLKATGMIGEGFYANLAKCDNFVVSG
jgi:hypothetical protein